MRFKPLLIGLIVGLLTLATTVARAQSVGGVQVQNLTVPTYNHPAGASFGWLNQNTATFVDKGATTGPLVLSSTFNNAGNDDLSCATIAVPGSGNWTYTVHATYYGGAAAGASSVFPLGLSDGTKIHVLGNYNVADNQWGNIVTHYSAHGTGVGNDYAAQPGAWPNPAWYRITWVAAGTTVTFQMSVDGQSWVTLYTSSSPYLTPTLAVACVDTKNNSALPLTININYWKQS